jgi:hypothetical protein
MPEQFNEFLDKDAITSGDGIFVFLYFVKKNQWELSYSTKLYLAPSKAEDLEYL